MLFAVKSDLSFKEMTAQAVEISQSSPVYMRYYLPF